MAAGGGIGCAGVGRQAAGPSDRKGSHMRACSRAPKPTKKWRTLGGERIEGGEGVAQALHDPTVCPIWGAPAWMQQEGGRQKG